MDELNISFKSCSKSSILKRPFLSAAAYLPIIFPFLFIKIYAGIGFTSNFGPMVPFENPSKTWCQISKSSCTMFSSHSSFFYHMKFLLFPSLVDYTN